MTRADQMTVAHLIEYMSARGHEIDLYILSGHEPIEVDASRWLSSRCRVVSITHKSRLRSLLDAGLAAVRGAPLQIGYFWSKRQAKALAEGFSTRNYDIAYVYYIRSAQIFIEALRLAERGSFRGASVLGMQLSQALNTRRMVERMHRRSDRLIYGIESSHLRRFEANIWQHFDRVVLIGKKDQDELSQVSREIGHPEPSNVFLCAHGVDIDEFRPDNSEINKEATLVFSGVMRTNTNVHAITWFAKHVWPRVKTAFPDAQLDVVGRQPSADVRALAQLPGITVTGEVASTADYIRKATVCINPMQVGAGMQNKLLEYLAMGKATVATALANEGIGAVSGRDLMIADTAEQFAEKTIELLGNEARRSELGRNARTFVQNSWSWEAQFRLLEDEFIRLSAAKR